MKKKTHTTFTFCYLFSYPLPFFLLLIFLCAHYIFFISFFLRINTFHSLWLFAPPTVDPGFVIKLDFRNRFYIEPSATCEYDYLEVRWTRKMKKKTRKLLTTTVFNLHFQFIFDRTREKKNNRGSRVKLRRTWFFFTADKRHIIEQSSTYHLPHTHIPAMYEQA